MIRSIKTILSLLFLFTANASAAIVYVNDGRYIEHTGGGNHLFTPTAPFAPFTKNFFAYEAGAFQDSSMNNTLMSGTGTTFAGPDARLYGATGRSVYDVTFTVDQLTNFSLNGTITTSNLSSQVTGSLRGNGSELFAMNPSPYGGVGAFSFNGVFAPGTQYRLILDSFSFNSAYVEEGWKFNLTTSPVPVPAAVWLLGSGLLGLIGMARRKAV